HGLTALHLVASEAPRTARPAAPSGPTLGALALAAGTAAPRRAGRRPRRARAVGLAHRGRRVARLLRLDRLLGRGRHGLLLLGAAGPAAATTTGRGHRLTTATAKAAMPSARPMAPRPSARLPLTVTGAPTASLRRSCMA